MLFKSIALATTDVALIEALDTMRVSNVPVDAVILDALT